MRSLRKIKRDVAHAPVRVDRQADHAVLEHLRRELSASRASSSAAARTKAGPYVVRLAACLALATMITTTVAWRLHTSRTAGNGRFVSVVSTEASGITLLREVSLERAFRRGGMAAVESQFQKALPAPAQESATPSLEQLLAELAGDGRDKGGTSS
jgi:hypothetical protein